MTRSMPSRRAIRYADELSWGLTVVAALLWFAAFVALFRRDVGNPLVASASFAALGGASWLAALVFRALGRRTVDRQQR